MLDRPFKTRTQQLSDTPTPLHTHTHTQPQMGALLLCQKHVTFSIFSLPAHVCDCCHISPQLNPCTVFASYSTSLSSHVISSFLLWFKIIFIKLGLINYTHLNSYSLFFTSSLPDSYWISLLPNLCIMSFPPTSVSSTSSSSSSRFDPTLPPLSFFLFSSSLGLQLQTLRVDTAHQPTSRPHYWHTCVHVHVCASGAVVTVGPHRV